MLSKESKIMVVDDMKLIRTALRKYLAALGYNNIIEAVNGGEAVEKQSSESPDFIFMDIVMPVKNGDEALREIRQSDNQVPIVMLTSVADEGKIKECEGEGILGYAIKPINKDVGPGVLSEFLEKV